MSSDWNVTIDHPESGRPVTPNVLSDPQFSPNPNGQPELVIPISYNDLWLSDQWDNADVNVSNDGKDVPVEKLSKQRQTNGHIELIAKGGTELEDTANVEIGEQFSHEAFGELVGEHTTYGVDIDDPSEELTEDVLMQNPSSDADLNTLTDFNADEPATVANGAKLVQTCYHKDGYRGITDGSTQFPDNGTDFSGAPTVVSEGLGVANRLTNDGDTFTYEFDVQYTIPEDALGLWIRWSFPDARPGFVLRFDGTEYADVNGFDEDPFPDLPDPHWRDTAAGFFFNPEWDNGDIEPGTHTWEIECTDSDVDWVWIDRLAVVDNRFNYNFDNEPVWTGEENALDGPELFPDVYPVQFMDTTSIFAIINGSAEITIDDTSADQFLQLSNDQGASYLPENGDEDNTDSVSVSFDEPGSPIRLRVGLSRYSPDGPQDVTPRLGYASQTVTGFEIRADLDESPFTVDYASEDSLLSILQDVAGQAFVFEFTFQNGEPTMVLTQPGTRVANRAPDLAKLTLEKDTELYEQVTVKGSNRHERNDTFTATDTLQELSRERIIPGSETVRDDEGTTYDRGDDYDIQWTDGQIRRLADSDLTQSETYIIDYDFEVRGTYSLDGVQNPKERVVSVPHIVSERSAETLAQQFVSILSEPQWSAEALIPPREQVFSGIEALNLALRDADLPDSAMPLTPRGEPRIEPMGIRFELGSGFEFSEILQDVQSRTESIARRV